MGRRGLRLITLAAVPVLVLSACGGSNNSPSVSTSCGSSASATANVTPPPGKTKVAWYVGPGPRGRAAPAAEDCQVTTTSLPVPTKKTTQNNKTPSNRFNPFRNLLVVLTPW